MRGRLVFGGISSQVVAIPTDNLGKSGFFDRCAIAVNRANPVKAG
jgi:hypothetical protein